MQVGSLIEHDNGRTILRKKKERNAMRESVALETVQVKNIVLVDVVNGQNVSACPSQAMGKKEARFATFALGTLSFARDHPDGGCKSEGKSWQQGCKNGWNTNGCGKLWQMG